jgi:lysyl-tRNA synthetase class 2
MPSSVIQSFEYHSDQRELLVVFRSGRSYVYEEVAGDIYQAMRRSFSKGEYFNEHIRDRYAFRRIA